MDAIMKNISMTHHAEVRQQQRCISDLQVETLLRFGTKKRVKGEAFACFIERAILRDLIANIKTKINQKKNKNSAYNMNNSMIKSIDLFISEMSLHSGKKLCALLDTLTRLGNTRLIICGDTVLTVMHGYKKLKTIY
jgi:hypothetical protein